MTRQGETISVTGKQQKRFKIRGTVAKDPISARDTQMAEAILAKLVARTYVADHPELFGPHLARTIGGPADD